MRGCARSNERLEEAKAQANSDQVKVSLMKVQQLEQSWAKEFSQPLIEKRKDVDSGNATVAELQIYYLQKDASSWVKNSTDTLDIADGENHKEVEARQSSDRPPPPGQSLFLCCSPWPHCQWARSSPTAPRLGSPNR